MADKHPYISSSGAIVQLLDQLRSAFPQQVTSETLKKLNIAPANESYAINTIRFLGLIDADGNRRAEAHQVFVLHDDAAFRKAFSQLVSDAYKDLFDLRGEKAWTLDESHLIAYFRGTDQSTALVGGRQAKTFKTLATYAGYAPPSADGINAPVKKAAPPRQRKGKTQKNDTKAPEQTFVQPAVNGAAGAKPPVGLTVRIEVNLPSSGDQETYDRIFKSIRENLLNGA